MRRLVILIVALFVVACSGLPEILVPPSREELEPIVDAVTTAVITRVPTIVGENPTSTVVATSTLVPTETPEPVVKMLMVTSYAETERLMLRATELHEKGVRIVGLNTENGPGMTPPDEMETLFSLDPNVNIISRVASLAAGKGFSVMWGPIRNVTDLMLREEFLLEDATKQDNRLVIRMIYEAGVRGIAFQEQKPIEEALVTAKSRVEAVTSTRNGYIAVAQSMGIADEITFHVQIMESRCPDLQKCVDFVAGLEAIPVDSIAIWSNGPISVGFVNAIRRQ